MGFLAGAAAFTRYRITEPVPDTLWAEVADRLKKNAFREIDDTADERSFGWVSFEDMLDPAWREAPPQKGAYLAFSLRLDTRRVPPAVYKKHFLLALREEERKAQEAGRKFVSRERKKELREQVKLRLMVRTLPIPAVFEAVWNTQTGVIWLGSVTPKLRSLFEDHFTLTFNLHLEPLTPTRLALDVLGEARARELDNLEPTIFV
ncbi:MAG: recombination-associated protein RdgC [Thermodesulfobacteriota bacterium]